MFLKTSIATAIIASYCAIAVDLEAMCSPKQFDGEDRRDFSLNVDWTLSQNKAQAPQVTGWFKGDTYQSKTKEDKLADLWEMITDDDSVSPLPWADFDLVFS